MSNPCRLARSLGSWNGVRSPRRYGSHTGTRPGSPGRTPGRYRYRRRPAVPARPVGRRRSGCGPSPRTGRRRCSARRSGTARDRTRERGEPLAPPPTPSATTQTTRVAPKMTSTSPGWIGPGHDLLAERVDRPPAHRGRRPGTVPAGCPSGTMRRHLSLRHAQRGRARRGPSARRREQAPERGGGGRVDAGDAAQRMGGDGLARPVAGGPGQLAPTAQASIRRPSSRSPPCSAGRAPGPSPVRRPGPDVAVEQAGQPGDAPPVDGGDGRDHRRHHHAGRRGRRAPRDHPGEGPTGARAPRPERVVLEHVRRRAITRWGTRARATTVRRRPPPRP